MPLHNPRLSSGVPKIGQQFGSKNNKRIFHFFVAEDLHITFISEKYKQGLKLTSWLDKVYFNLHKMYLNLAADWC